MPNIIEITDFHAPELDVYARLTEAQLLNRHNLKEGLFIAESPNVIHRALDAGYEPVSFLMERKHIEGQAKDVIARFAELKIGRELASLPILIFMNEEMVPLKEIF